MSASKPIRYPAAWTARIVRCASAADDTDALWYADVNTWCDARAKRHRVSLPRVAAVVAALSPACGIRRNLNDAAVLIDAELHKGGRLPDGYLICTYGPNVEKARRLIHTWHDSELAAILKPTPHRGHKTFAFWHCIVRPDNTEHVVIDRHAVAVCHDRPGAYFDRTVTSHRYRNYAAAYKRAAQIIGRTPAQTQAMAWCAWRREKGVQ